MTTAVSTKGRTVGIKVQSSLIEQPSSFDEIRNHEDVTAPSEVKLGEVQPNMGHADPFDWSDKPITFEGVRENGLTIPVAFRRGATTTAPPIATMAESGGCGVYASADDTIATYTDEGAWTTTGSDDDDEEYYAQLVELDDGQYYPTLVLANTAGAVTPAMDLPSAASASNALIRMHTIAPRNIPVESTSHLAVELANRGPSKWRLYGCALGSFGEMVIEPQGQLTMAPTFHVADVVEVAGGSTGETFIDTTYLQRNQGNFRFEFADANLSGGIAHTNLELLKATFTPGFASTPIPGDGSSDCLNSIQGYIGNIPEQPKIVLELLMDRSYWAEFETTANTSKHLGFVWPTTDLDVPSYGVWAPNCYMIASPIADRVSEQYQKVTLTYGCNAAAGATPLGYRAEAPWLMSIHGQAS